MLVFVGAFRVLPIMASRRITKRRLDLSTIAPGRCAARMPTGPLRRSSVPARRRAIVGKSRVEPDRLHTQRLSLWFWRELSSDSCRLTTALDLLMLAGIEQLLQIAVAQTIDGKLPPADGFQERSILL